MRETLRTRSTVWLLLGALAFLYLSLFIPPNTPIHFAGDSSIYVLNATRMLEGESIYRDFFQFTLPGTELSYLALFKLIGPRIWIPNVTLIVLGLGLTALIMYVSRRVLVGWIAFLPALLFLTFAYWHWLDPTHHWFSTLMVMGALAVVIERRTLARLGLAGTLCGLATFFTQMKGVPALLGVTVFLLWERRRTHEKYASFLVKELGLLTAFVVTLATASAYFIWNAGWQRFLYCAVEFGIRYYPADSFNTWRVYMTDVHRPHSLNDLAFLAILLFIHALLPMIYILFFVRYRWQAQDHPREAWDRLMLVGLVGSFLFLSMAPSPSYLRLCAVSPPALILLVWFVGYPAKVERLALCCLWAAALGAFIVEPLARQTGWRAYLQLPTGRTAIRTQDFEEERWVLERVHPPEYFFGDPGMCFALDLRPAGPVDFIRPTDYTRPEQVRDLLEALERHKVRLIMWYSGLDALAAGDHLDPLRAYLRLHYHLAKTFHGGDQFWLRNENGQTARPF